MEVTQLRYSALVSSHFTTCWIQGAYSRKGTDQTVRRGAEVRVSLLWERSHACHEAGRDYLELRETLQSDTLTGWFRAPGRRQGMPCWTFQHEWSPTASQPWSLLYLRRNPPKRVLLRQGFGGHPLHIPPQLYPSSVAVYCGGRAAVASCVGG